MKQLILIASLMIGGLSTAQAISNVRETYGGRGVQVLVKDDFSATLNFDCAHGDVQAGRWPTGQSRISANGTYTPESGVRPLPGMQPRTEKAVYKANIDVHSGKMTLSVKVGNRRAVIYRLIAGQQADLHRCM